MASAVRASGWSACWWRTALVVVGACLGPIGALRAQAKVPSCGFSTAWRECALLAGNIADITRSGIGAGGRELRFWALSGIGVPDNLLILRQRGDSVSGELFLLWPASQRGDRFVKETCEREWWNDVGGACRARLSAPRDWKAVLGQLDALGLSNIPASPVPARPCRRPQPLPGQAPADWVCAVLADGIQSILEVRTLTSYWRYIFPGIPDTTSDGYLRNQQVLGLLSCVTQKRGDGPCLEDRRP